MSKVSSGLSLNKLLFNLAALADLGVEVTSSKDFKGIIKSALYLVMGTLSVSKGAIFQFDHDRYELNAVASKGLNGVNGMMLKLKKKEVEELIRRDTVIQRENIEGAIGRFFLRERGSLDKVMASILAPLIVRGALVGAVVLGRKFSGEEYTKDDYELLSVMTHHIAVSLYNHQLLLKLAHKMNENKRLYEELRLIYYDTIQAFAAAIDAKDEYTKGHSSRVSKYCVAIAKEMDFSKEGIEGIKVAGFLHDIGKIAVDKGIINKPSPLTKEEKLELNQHPVISYEILSRVKFPWSDVSINVRYHHEKIDGSGYPDRLKGEEIPVGAKIMALADAFDAMTTDRPYRKKLTLEETLMEVERTLGRQFDPEVGRCLFRIINKEIHGEGKRSTMLAGQTTLNMKRVVSTLLNRALEVEN